MGEKIQKLYDYIEQEGGVTAVLRAVLHSKLPHLEALEIEDTDKNIEKVKDAAQKILNRKHLNVKL